MTSQWKTVETSKFVFDPPSLKVRKGDFGVVGEIGALEGINDVPDTERDAWPREEPGAARRISVWEDTQVSITYNERNATETPLSRARVTRNAIPIVVRGRADLMIIETAQKYHRG